MQGGILIVMPCPPSLGTTYLTFGLKHLVILRPAGPGCHPTTDISAEFMSRIIYHIIGDLLCGPKIRLSKWHPAIAVRRALFQERDIGRNIPYAARPYMITFLWHALAYTKLDHHHDIP